MVTAALARSEFAPAVAAELAALLARPSLPDYFDSPDGRFRVHYTTTGGHAVPAADLDLSGVPDFVEKIALYADSSWRLQVSQYGYLPPPSDGSVGGGSDLYDIYCQSIGAYGYCAPESPGPEPWNDYTSYIAEYSKYVADPIALIDNYASSEDFVGVSVFQARSNTEDAYVEGTNNFSLTGTLYTPTAKIDIRGTSDNLASFLIANEIMARGDGRMVIPYDPRWPRTEPRVYLVD